MNIYINGKRTDYENIFDLLEEKGVCQWYAARTALIGRDLSRVLDDWTFTHKTHYFIDGKRYDFELK